MFSFTEEQVLNVLKIRVKQLTEELIAVYNDIEKICFDVRRSSVIVRLTPEAKALENTIINRLQEVAAIAESFQIYPGEIGLTEKGSNE